MPDATKVHVYDDGSLKGSFNVDGSGNWSGSVSFGSGASTLSAKAEDAAGNISSQSTKKVYAGSTTTPTCDLLDDSGESSTDNITNDNTPRIKVILLLDGEMTAMGVTPASSSVSALILEHSSDGGTNWSVLETNTTPTVSSEEFSFTHQIGAALADGQHKFRAKWKDAMGNESAYGSVLTITVDTAAPNAPTISSPANGQVFVGTSFNVSGTAS